MFCCGAKPDCPVTLKEPGLPVGEAYSPLFGDSGLPSGPGRFPSSHPTAASTAPPLTFVEPPGACTTTSVTSLASMQPLTLFDFPAHAPVGSFTLRKVRPASVEPNSPEPVATYTRLGWA